jgi:phage tail-like protein
MSASVDRYNNFRYRVQWTGRYVAGFMEISDLPDKTSGAGHLRSGRPRPSIGPEGQGTPFFISLERGVSFDLGFEQWVCMVRSFGPATGKGSLLPEYRRPFIIEGYDENGKLMYTYNLSCCWVTEYKATPGPDTGANEMRIEHLKLGFESWGRELPESS